MAISCLYVEGAAAFLSDPGNENLGQIEIEVREEGSSLRAALLAGPREHGPPGYFHRLAISGLAHSMDPDAPFRLPAGSYTVHLKVRAGADANCTADTEWHNESTSLGYLKVADSD